MTALDATVPEITSPQWQFMKQHNFYSAAESLATILPTVFAIFVVNGLKQHYSNANKRLNVLLEFFIIVLPLCFFNTIWIEYRKIYFLAMLSLFAIFHVKQHMKLPQVWDYIINRDCRYRNHCERKWKCLVYMRTLVVLFVTLRILAPEFKIFPRIDKINTDDKEYVYLDALLGVFIFSLSFKHVKSRYNFTETLEDNFAQYGLFLFFGLLKSILNVTFRDYSKITEFASHKNMFYVISITMMLACIIIAPVKKDMWEFYVLPLWIIWYFSDWFGDTCHKSYLFLSVISSEVGVVIRKKFILKREKCVITNLFLTMLFSWIFVILIPYLSVTPFTQNFCFVSFVVAVGSTTLMLLYMYEINDIFQRTEKPYLHVFKWVEDNSLGLIMISYVASIARKYVDDFLSHSKDLERVLPAIKLYLDHAPKDEKNFVFSLGFFTCILTSFVIYQKRTYTERGFLLYPRPDPLPPIDQDNPINYPDNPELVRNRNRFEVPVNQVNRDPERLFNNPEVYRRYPRRVNQSPDYRRHNNYRPRIIAEPRDCPVPRMLTRKYDRRRG